MSGDKKEGGGKGSEQTTLMLVGALLFFALLAKAWPTIHAFWMDHRITLTLSLWAGGFSLVVALVVWLWNSYVKRCHEESVIEPDSSAVHLGKEIK